MTEETNAVAAIEKTMTFAASPERVWEALTDPAELASWFPESVEGFTPAPGGEGWLVWDNHGRYAIRMEAYEPRTRIVWRWARESETPLEDGPTTRVEWRLEPSETGGTLLHLHESGFLSTEARGQNVMGWEHELGELTDYLR
ncbi:MAG: SRPBCC domain-containing protein [Gemmatimonadota bacterium]|nr:SRPBCC domain-containing protein [Gemmatimonadota bacterium]